MLIPGVVGQKSKELFFLFGVEFKQVPLAYALKQQFTTGPQYLRQGL